jgi:hypothetical protein
MSGRFKTDAARFSRMAEPYASRDEAVQSADAFLRAVQRLRVKHRIKNVICIVSMDAMVDGKPEAFTMRGTHGDMKQFVPLLAYTLGREERVYSEMMRAQGSEVTP